MRGANRPSPFNFLTLSAWLLSQTGAAAATPATTAPEALPSGQKCTPETVDLTEAGGPLAGEKGLVQDQDGLGVCYANVGSLLLNGITPPGTEPVSFLDLSLNHSSLQASGPAAKLVRTDSKKGQAQLTLEGGLSCDVINEALEKGYLCPRSAVPLENHAFNQQGRWGLHDTAGSDAQKSLLLAYGKVIDVLKNAPDSVKTRWSEKMNLPALVQSSNDFTKCDASNVSTHNLEDFVLISVQKILLGKIHNEERIEEIKGEVQLSAWSSQQLRTQQKETEGQTQKINEELGRLLKSETVLTDEEILKKTSGLRGVFRNQESLTRIRELLETRKKNSVQIQELEKIIQNSTAEVEKLKQEAEQLKRDNEARKTFLAENTEVINEYGQLKLKTETADRLRNSGAYEAALYSQSPALAQIRKTNRSATPSVPLGDTALAAPLTAFLVQTAGMKSEWIDLNSPPIPLGTLSDDLISTDPEVCARSALADILILNEGVVKSCTQVSSPAEEKAVIALSDALNELGTALYSTDVPAEDFARALTSGLSPHDFERTLQALLAPQCHAGSQRITLPANTPRCLQENFPPDSIGYLKAPPKSPRSAAELDSLRPHFRKQVYDRLTGKAPVGLDLCSASFSDPQIDRGNIHCTDGLHGFHAVTAIGYTVHSDCSVEYLIQNSWGSSNCPLPQVLSNDPNAPSMIPSPQCSGGRFWLSEDILLRNTFHTNAMEPSR